MRLVKIGKGIEVFGVKINIMKVFLIFLACFFLIISGATMVMVGFYIGMVGFYIGGLLLHGELDLFFLQCLGLTIISYMVFNLIMKFVLRVRFSELKGFCIIWLGCFFSGGALAWLENLNSTPLELLILLALLVIFGILTSREIKKVISVNK